MRLVRTGAPSFPEAVAGEPLAVEKGCRWQVLCGDGGHWRVGVYCPEGGSREDVRELEQHDCPEMFMLLEGELTLVLFEDGAVREVALERGRPVLVTQPHGGYCPRGPHTGTALVVERDAFETVYRDTAEWAGLGR